MKKSIWLIAIFILFLVNISTATQVCISPIDQLVIKDTKFNISIYCIPSEPIKSYEFKIEFDQAKIRFDSYTEGDIFEGYSTFFSPTFEIDNENGSILKIYSLIVGQGNVTEAGYLLNLSGTALDVTNGIPMITLVDAGVTNEYHYLSNVVTNGKVEVRGVNRYDVDGSRDITPTDVSIVWEKRDNYCLLYDVDNSQDIVPTDLSIIWFNRS